MQKQTGTVLTLLRHQKVDVVSGNLVTIKVISGKISINYPLQWLAEMCISTLETAVPDDVIMLECNANVSIQAIVHTKLEILETRTSWYNALSVHLSSLFSLKY